MKRLSLVPLCIFLIALYKRCISPYLAPRCRFLPSCSEYSSTCYKKYGFFKGTYKTIGRLFRCHPFCDGGVDMP